MLPKVLVGTPMSFHKEYCLEEFLSGIKNLTYKNFDFVIVENSKDDQYFNKLKSLGLNVIKGLCTENPVSNISKARNITIKKALDEGYDYVLFLDSDVIPIKDMIEKLVSHKKDVVCGIYFSRMKINEKIVLVPGVFKLFNEVVKDEKGLPSMVSISLEEVDSSKLIKVISCGGGALLVHKNVLKKVKFREDLKQYEDRRFCIDLYLNNIPIYCDTFVICKHMIRNRPYLWQNGKLIKREELEKKLKRRDS